MFKSDELHQKIQEETYKIICEGIDEYDRKLMQLAPNEIIPTINFFKRVQTALIDRLANNKPLEFECIYLNYDYETNKEYVAFELLNVNKSFLSYLCRDAGIEFYSFEDRYHFETTGNELCADIKKKYHV